VERLQHLGGKRAVSVWQKTILWLGLGPDEAYGAYEDQPIMRGPLASPEFDEARNAGDGDGKVYELRARSGLAHPKGSGSEEVSGTVRPLRAASTAMPLVISPGAFDDAKEVADRFLNGQPVAVNLNGVGHETARRIIDFASGLCYGHGGQLERVNNQVYLLSPTGVEVAVEEKLRIRDEGLGDHN
jgi:cell division inhibitor SepF